MQVTFERLKTLFPYAINGYLRAITENLHLLQQYGLNEPLPFCHFLAQCAHETGEFTIVEESGNYTAERLREVFKKYFTPGQARAYAHRSKAILSRAYANRMGNRGEASGDGWKYRGRSFMQTTGRDNYAKLSKWVDFDLLEHPEQLANNFILGLRAAVLEWSELGLNEIVAKLGPTHAAVLAAGRGINVGRVKTSIIPNGFADRKRLFAKIWDAFGDGAAAAVDPAADGILEEGERGLEVVRMQRLLAALGYAVGEADGIFGPRTRDAVVACQAREELGGELGKWRIEWEDHVAEKAEVHDDEARRDVTIDDLKAKGDPVAAGTRVLKVGAGIGAALGVIHETVEPITQHAQWIASNKWALWIVAGGAVVTGVWWIETKLVERYRLFQAHS